MDLKDKCLELLRDRGLLGPDAEVTLSPLAGGNSHVTWRIRISRDPANAATSKQFVVKVAQPDGPLAPYDIAHEGQMMDLAYAAGVATPKLIGVDVSDPASSLMVMEHIEGEAPSLAGLEQWLQREQVRREQLRGEQVRREVGRALLGALSQMRRALPQSQHPRSLSGHYSAYIDNALRQLTASATGWLPVPPAVVAATQWLRERSGMLDGATPALVHGDFRIGNVIFRGTQLAAVLDWERAMPGHPLHDLGYLCLPGMRRDELLGGLLTQSELVADWGSALGGESLDLRLCTYFKILSIYTELCAMLRAMAHLAAGRGRLVGLRPLPLIIHLQADLVAAIRSWNDGQFAL